MRDSDMAIGGLVLMGLIGAFFYFLFPKVFSDLLRGPSPTEIVRSVRSEVSVFENENKVIEDYLENSRTMKVYRRFEYLLGPGHYENWIQNVKTKRDRLIAVTIQNLERQRESADRLSAALESRKSTHKNIKRNIFDFAKDSADSEIENLQAELDKKRAALLGLKEKFSETRRELNQKVLMGWFGRSLLVGLLTATIVILSSAVVLLIRGTGSTVASNGNRDVSNRLSFASKPPRQSGLIKVIEGPVLVDSAFHFTFHFEMGLISQPIASAFEDVPKTSTALKLAAILGGYPNTPASRSHHLSDPGGLIIHTAKVLKHSEPLLSLLPDSKIGPVVILAHDIGKVFTLNSPEEGRPHDIPSADILASLQELREEFDEITARSMILALRHQHAKAEIPLNVPPLTETIFQFIKKADLAASAEESREAAERMKALLPRVIDVFPYIIPELNVNGCMGGRAEGYLSDGYLFLLKEPVKEKLLNRLETQNAPVFKGQDPVWNEMALALTEAGLITTKIGERDAGKKSCLFTIKTPQGQEKTIAIPVASLAPHLIDRWLQTNIPKIEVL
jgi:hypothetical protein